LEGHPQQAETIRMITIKAVDNAGLAFGKLLLWETAMWSGHTQSGGTASAGAGFGKGQFWPPPAQAWAPPLPKRFCQVFGPFSWRPGADERRGIGAKSSNSDRPEGRERGRDLTAKRFFYRFPFHFTLFSVLGLLVM